MSARKDGIIFVLNQIGWKFSTTGNGGQFATTTLITTTPELLAGPWERPAEANMYQVGVITRLGRERFGLITWRAQAANHLSSIAHIVYGI